MMEKETNKTVLYIPTLEIDISCTPGGVTHTVHPHGFLSREKCQEVVDKLNEELKEELDIPTFEDWFCKMYDEESTDVIGDEYDGYDLDGLKEMYEDDVDECEPEDDFRGFNLSGQPYWSIDVVTVVE